MSRPPPRSTRTDTLVPYTTLCRSNAEIEVSKRDDVLKVANAVLRYKPSDDAAGGPAPRTRGGGGMVDDLTRTAASLKLDANQQAAFDAAVETIRQRQAARQRSEERRVGKECVRKGRYRGSHRLKKK